MYNNNVCIWYIKCIVYNIWKIVFIIKSSQKYVVTHDIIDIFWCLKYVPWCLCLISNEYIRWTGWRMSWWVSRRSTRPSPRSSSRPSLRCLDIKYVVWSVLRLPNLIVSLLSWTLWWLCLETWKPTYQSILQSICNPVMKHEKSEINKWICYNLLYCNKFEDVWFYF